MTEAEIAVARGASVKVGSGNSLSRNANNEASADAVRASGGLASQPNGAGARSTMPSMSLSTSTAVTAEAVQNLGARVVRVATEQNLTPEAAAAFFLPLYNFNINVADADQQDTSLFVDECCSVLLEDLGVQTSASERAALATVFPAHNAPLRDAEGSLNGDARVMLNAREMLMSFGLWPAGNGSSIPTSRDSREGNGVNLGKMQLPTLDSYDPADDFSSSLSSSLRASGRGRVSGHAGLDQLRTSRVRFSIDEDDGNDGSRAHRESNNASSSHRSNNDYVGGSNNGGRSWGRDSSAAVRDVYASGGVVGGGGSGGEMSFDNHEPSFCRDRLNEGGAAHVSATSSAGSTAAAAPASAHNSMVERYWATVEPEVLAQWEAKDTEEAAYQSPRRRFALARDGQPSFDNPTSASAGIDDVQSLNEDGSQQALPQLPSRNDMEAWAINDAEERPLPPLSSEDRAAVLAAKGLRATADLPGGFVARAEATTDLADLALLDRYIADF